MLIRVVHYLMTLLGIFTWAVGNVFYSITVALAVLGDRMFPNYPYGTCWSWTFPKWWKYGGYLLVRPADGVKFLNFFPVPHVLWIKSLPKQGVELLQFVPIKRKQAKWWPWFTTYYKGKVHHIEFSHSSKEIK